MACDVESGTMAYAQTVRRYAVAPADAGTGVRGPHGVPREDDHTVEPAGEGIRGRHRTADRRLRVRVLRDGRRSRRAARSAVHGARSQDVYVQRARADAGSDRPHAVLRIDRGRRVSRETLD